MKTRPVDVFVRRLAGHAQADPEVGRFACALMSVDMQTGECALVCQQGVPRKLLAAMLRSAHAEAFAPSETFDPRRT